MGTNIAEYAKVTSDTDKVHGRRRCSLFINDEPLSVVLQNAEGSVLHFTLGDQEEATMSWQEFQETVTADLKAQNYQKTESECLGVLSDRMIMETGRINQANEVYQESFALIPLNKEGKIAMLKITMLESFSDVKVASLTEKAEEVKA